TRSSSAERKTRTVGETSASRSSLRPSLLFAINLLIGPGMQERSNAKSVLCTFASLMLHWQYETQTLPSAGSNDAWAFVAPYLTLMAADVLQRAHSMREVFHGLRWIVRASAAWRMRPHDLRMVLPLAQGRKAAPSAVISDSHTLPSTPESG